MTERASGRTSVRAWVSLGIVVAAYFAVAVVAGVPRSPLTVPLPPGAAPPSWASSLARVAGLDQLGRHDLIGVSWLLVLLALGAFAVVLSEAWSGRLRLSAVLVTSAMSLAVSVAAPLLLSRDVYTYAAYGRIEAVFHRDPYVTTLSSYPHDPFVSVTSAQWLHTHSVYGPVFTLLSAGIVRMWAGSPGTTILAFKLLSGIAIAAATAFVALVARRTQPGRAPFAAALVGLNPVLVIHTVGGGHVDALIAAPLAAAMAIAATRPRPASAGAVAVTVLLTVACLIKGVMLPALALWIWWLVRTGHDHRRRAISLHVAAITALVLAAVAPFRAGWHTLAPFASLGGVEVWASPSHLVGRAAQAIVGALGGSTAARDAARVTTVGAFLFVFVVLVSRLARRVDRSDASSPVELWGVTLLLLALTMPYLLPWYAAWFAPFIGLLADEALVLTGALVTGVLALTLIPADPFHGRTSAPVMNGVHYGAAPVLLLALLVVSFRVRATRSGDNRRAPLIAAPEENELGSAVTG